MSNIPLEGNTDLIACVGTNGNPSTRHYAFGFLNAADVLLEQQRMRYPKRPKYPPDYMVYPICFNIRHGIEISLKYFLDKVAFLAELRNLDSSVETTHSHNISELWACYLEVVSELDARLSSLARTLDRYISPWADIDATGQTFRYAVSNDSTKHLNDYSTIDLLKVSLNLESLKTHLEDNFHLLVELEREYELQTHTKTMSRWELYKLAQELPNRNRWGCESFKIVKERWCNERTLSAREFSKACNLIQNNREFASLIGVELPLFGGVKHYDIGWALREWVQYHDELSDRNTNDPTATQAYSGYGATEQIRRRWKNDGVLSPELVAMLSSLYYNAGARDYSEDFQVHYELEMKQLSSASDEGIFESFVHLIEKSSLLDDVYQNLQLLGQETLYLRNDSLIARALESQCVEELVSKTASLSEWYGSLPKRTRLGNYFRENSELN